MGRQELIEKAKEIYENENMIVGNAREDSKGIMFTGIDIDGTTDPIQPVLVLDFDGSVYYEALNGVGEFFDRYMSANKIL